jgi:hypothetical protein
MLFRLNIMRAAVVDIPMDAKYDDEVSNLRVGQVVFEFLGKHARNFFKRIFYSYYLRDMSLASIELPVGLLLLLFGTIYGAAHWIESMTTGVTASSGTVMLAAMPVLVGVQLVLAFVGHDVSSMPRRAIHPRLGRGRSTRGLAS